MKVRLIDHHGDEYFWTLIESVDAPQLNGFLLFEDETGRRVYHNQGLINEMWVLEDKS